MSERRLHQGSGLPMISGGGEWRILGALPSPKLTALPYFAERYAAKPRSEWVDCSLKQWTPAVLDQGTHGSCVGQAWVTGFRYIWKISGQPDHDFSPTFVYGHINGNRDAGAQVVDGGVSLKTNGTCLITQVGQNTVFKHQFPAEAFKTAKRFRLLETFRVSSFDELCSAVLMGFPVISGIAVGTNFGSLSSEGVCPLPNQVAGGHALCHIGLKRVRGGWSVETQNSWGRGWGLGGYCYLQEGAWNPRYGFPMDAWAVTGVLDDPEESTTDTPTVLQSGEKHEERSETADV